MDVWPTGAIVSGFGDEIHPDLDVQVEVLGGFDIKYLDLRGVDGRTVLEFEESDLRDIETALAAADVQVATVGSPIGKVDVRGGRMQTASRDAAGETVADFERQLEQLETVLRVADRLDASGVRVFSYYIPEDEAPSDHRDTVLDRIRRMTEIASGIGIPLLHENMPGTYGATPQRVRDLLTAVDSPYFRAIYEPANFYAAGATPYPDALLSIVEYVDCVHVKDARGAGDWETEDVDLVPVGDGDLPWEAILEAFSRRGYAGAFALEPHLAVTEAGPALSGREPFGRAARAFLKTLAGIDTR